MKVKNKLQILNIIAAVLLMLMFLVVFAQIISRYIFNHAFSWSDELAKYLLIYTSMLGAVLAEDQGSNVRFTYLVDRLPRMPRIAAEILGSVIVVSFYIVSSIYGMKLAISSHFMQGVALPGIRWSYIYGIVPVVFAILCIMHIKSSVKIIKDLSGNTGGRKHI